MRDSDPARPPSVPALAPIDPDAAPVRSTFGERYAFARWWREGMIARDVGADAFAVLVGLTPSALSHWRDREDAPGARFNVQLVADLCGVSRSWLAWNEGSVPTLFPQFLPVYRAWVKAGGLRRGAATRVREQLEAAKRGKAPARKSTPTTPAPDRTVRQAVSRPITRPTAGGAKKKRRGNGQKGA